MRTDLSDRARLHAALGEEHRLQMVDALLLSDRTPSDLQELTGLGSNLLSFHLDVLADAGLILRRRSEGDGRRRYVSLRTKALGRVAPTAAVPDGPVLFVCTRNAARSQLAAALWASRTGRPAGSAGTDPAAAIDPGARRVADAHGLDLGETPPRHYDDVTETPRVVVSVCDRAHESGLPWTLEEPTGTRLHWSVPDPAGGDDDAYDRAFVDIATRIDRLAAAHRN